MSVTLSAADVKKLRDMTGAGMMDCKKALEASNGDMEAAIDYLRKLGQKLSVKRADREAKEGVVIAQVSHNRNNGIIIRLSCETDFVAKNENFIALAQSIADIAIKTLPASLEELLNTSFDGKIPVSEKISEQLGVIGEKVELAQYEKIETAAGAGQVLPYIHMGYRAGVLVSLNQEGPDLQDAGKNVAMQVAAMKPVALDKGDVDTSIVEREMDIAREQIRAEGKPEEMVERIAQGKLAKFYKDNTLLNQLYVKNDKQTITEYLNSVSKGLTVTAYKHVTLG
jgi:elongation factor Ts